MLTLAFGSCSHNWVLCPHHCGLCHDSGSLAWLTPSPRGPEVPLFLPVKILGGMSSVGLLLPHAFGRQLPITSANWSIRVPIVSPLLRPWSDAVDLALKNSLWISRAEALLALAEVLLPFSSPWPLDCDEDILHYLPVGKDATKKGQVA
jgi:hypothetical protein